MKNFVNLTPHALEIKRKDGTFLNVPASGTVLRIPQTDTYYGNFAEVDVNVSKTTFGEFDAAVIPDLRDGTIYIVSLVSLLMSSELRGRYNVFAPGNEIRDDNGRIVGCDGLRFLAE